MVTRRLTERLRRRYPELAQQAAVGRLRGGIINYALKYGPDSDQVLAVRRDYAVALLQYGEDEKARDEFSAVAERRRAAGRESDDDFLRGAEIGYATALVRLENFEEAERECRELSERYDRVLGPGHADAFGAHENHAMTLFKLGRAREAEKEMAVAVSRRAAADGDDAPETLTARATHAVYLRASERYGDAEKAWGELAGAMTRVLGAAHASTLDSREEHIRALHQVGRLREAVAECGELAEYYAAALGVDHPDTRRTRDAEAFLLREIDSSGGGPS